MSFAPELTRDGVLSSSERRRLDASWMRLSADGARHSLQVWRADGSLQYRQHDDRFPHAAPFRSGSVPRKEWSAQRHSSRLLEVYRPIVIDGRVRAVVGLAEPVGPLLADEAAPGAGSGSGVCWRAPPCCGWRCCPSCCSSHRSLGALGIRAAPCCCAVCGAAWQPVSWRSTTSRRSTSCRVRSTALKHSCAGGATDSLCHPDRSCRRSSKAG